MEHSSKPYQKEEFLVIIEATKIKNERRIRNV
ncbi:hypothetical protein MEZE111188_11120 [Mesobacillus zeae]